MQNKFCPFCGSPFLSITTSYRFQKVFPEIICFCCGIIYSKLNKMGDHFTSKHPATFEEIKEEFFSLPKSSKFQEYPCYNCINCDSTGEFVRCSLRNIDREKCRPWDKKAKFVAIS